MLIFLNYLSLKRNITPYMLEREGYCLANQFYITHIIRTKNFGSHALVDFGRLEGHAVVWL